MANKGPVNVKIENYNEETGLITFEADDAAKEVLIELGFKYMLMLGALTIDEDDVFQILEAYKENLIKETLQQAYEYWHEGAPV
jgi:hypothetical protein